MRAAIYVRHSSVNQRDQRRRLPAFKAVLEDPKTVWTPVIVTERYGGRPRKLEIVADTALWYNSGLPPASIRWVLVRDPTGEREPQSFLSTDLAARPEQILGWFVSRWRMETTFQEVRTHLGVETQRQWSDLAILRTTPALLGLFSLITIWADRLVHTPIGIIMPRTAAWYAKREPTFSDAIAVVRQALWWPLGLSISRRTMRECGYARWTNLDRWTMTDNPQPAVTRGRVVRLARIPLTRASRPASWVRLRRQHAGLGLRWPGRSHARRAEHHRRSHEMATGRENTKERATEA